MYNEKLVASLKANGRILREFKDTVYVPFGSEYSILIKNLHTQRAVVNVFIDGVDQTPGGLVVPAGQSIDLERSLANGSMTAGNKFKFIERTAGIEQHRGVQLEDGIIRLEYQFEKAPVPISTWRTDNGWPVTFGNNNQPVWTKNIGGALRGVDFSQNGAAVQAQASLAVEQYCADNGIKSQCTNIHDGAATMDWMDSEPTRSRSLNDAGITVAGSKSTQKFTTVHMGALEATKHSIVLKILGETADNKPVTEAVTVKAQPKCPTCGKQNKATAKFCSDCGTALVLFS